jgi:hypothetical protein
MKRRRNDRKTRESGIMTNSWMICRNLKRSSLRREKRSSKKKLRRRRWSLCRRTPFRGRQR